LLLIYNTLNAPHWPHTPWENMMNCCLITEFVITYCSMSDTKLVVKAPEVRRVSDAVPPNRTQSSTSFTRTTRTISPRYLPLIYFSNLQTYKTEFHIQANLVLQITTYTWGTRCSLGDASWQVMNIKCMYRIYLKQILKCSDDGV
jgi:hypothetical protein